MKTPKKSRGRPVTGHRKYPITAFVPKEAYRAIERFAASHKITRSEAVRRLIDLSLKAMKNRNNDGG